jgi:hypothetical protein
VSTVAVSRRSVIADVRRRARADSVQVRRIDRLEAKLLTHGELRDATDPRPCWERGFDPGRLVWVVAFAGSYRPQFGRGREFPWGVFVVDATTGEALGSNAGPEGAWPPYWDMLPDRDRGGP